jgi:hypothetical protein
MLPDNQEVRIRCYKNAVRNWRFNGYVNFKPIVEEWLTKEFPEIDMRQVAQELCRHVEAGGVIDEQKERRAEFVHYEFHYDLRLTLANRYLYFETVLSCDDANDPDDPQIDVVSVHDV